MKSLIAVLIASFSFFAIALTEPIEVLCTNPDGFAGSSATINGTLVITDSTQKYPILEGKLAITAGGSTEELVYAKKDIQFRGVLLDNGIVQGLAENDERINVIVIDQNNADLSSVEINGVRYLTDCTN